MEIKKILSVAFALTLVFPAIVQIDDVLAEDSQIWNGRVDTSWYSDYASILHIESASQLAGVAELVNSGNSMKGKTIVLDNDICLNEISSYDSWKESVPENEWEPIGISSEYSFEGCFDGGKNTIYGMYINGNYQYSGLFGYCSNSSEVTDLNIESCFSSVSYSNSALSTMPVCSGGVAGRTDGNVSNCTSSCYIYSYYDCGSVYAGGLVGYSSGVIDNCKNYGRVSSVSESMSSCSYAGGIVGNTDSNVKKCVNNGKIEAKYKGVFSTSSARIYAGGITGYSSSEISESINNGEVSACSETDKVKSICSGGISGTSFGNISKCVNNADIFVSGIENSCSGGISGKSEVFSSSSIVKNLNYGNISGGQFVGGISGIASVSADICANRGDIYTDYEKSYVGGLFGEFKGSSKTVSNAYSCGNVVGSGDSGKIIGLNSGSNLSLKNIYTTTIFLNDGSMIGNNSSDSGLNIDYENTFHLSFANIQDDYSTPKSKAELCSKEFSDLLGEYFVYNEGGYPTLFIEEDIEKIDIVAGESYDLKNDFENCKFKTSDSNIVSIKDGVISAVSSGYSVITVEDSDGSIKFVRVNVYGEKLPEQNTDIVETTQKQSERITTTSKTTMTTTTRIKATILHSYTEAVHTTTKPKIKPSPDGMKVTTDILETTESGDSKVNLHLGDVNNDGNVDSKDAVIILKKYAKSLIEGKVTGISVSRADVNKDGNVDSKDSVLILKFYAAKLAGSFTGSMSEYVS